MSPAPAAPSAPIDPSLRGAHAPLAGYREYVHGRGMSVTRDWFDWLGGSPFEVATPEEVLDFLGRHGFRLERLTTGGGAMGCNAFVARRVG